MSREYTRETWENIHMDKEHRLTQKQTEQKLLQNTRIHTKHMWCSESSSVLRSPRIRQPFQLSPSHQVNSHISGRKVERVNALIHSRMMHRCAPTFGSTAVGQFLLDGVTGNWQGSRAKPRGLMSHKTPAVSQPDTVFTKIINNLQRGAWKWVQPCRLLGMLT
jgi:hypothetical protein